MDVTYPVEGSPAESTPSVTRRRRSRHSRRSHQIVAALVAAAAVGGAFAGGHPTGVSAVDVVYSAAAAALITLAASRATRSSLLVMTAAGFAFSRSWLFIPAAAALILAFTSVFQKRAYRRLNAVVGALGSQVLLRLAPVGFHGLTAIVATAVALLVLVDGWRHCASRTRRNAARTAGAVVGLAVVFTVPVVLSALLARSPVSRGIALARGSLNTVESGEASAATAQLRSAATSLGNAHSDVAGWWDVGGYLVPGVAQQERALARGTGAGAALTTTAAAQAAHLNFSSLRYTGGRIDLAAVRAFQAPAETLNDAVMAAQAKLHTISSPWLLAPIADRLTKLGAVLDKAHSTTDLAVMGVKDAPALLGGDGVRHYFVAFMSPAETRGLGGFIGAYGELTVDNGRISLTTSGRASDLTNNGTIRTDLTGPLSYVQRYGAFNPGEYFQDLTYAPDLPTVGAVLEELYPQVQRDHLDGVLVLDPDSLASLLHFTGPLSVKGFPQPLTFQNAAQVLLREQYLSDDLSSGARHDLLQQALSQGFTRLTTGSLPSLKTIAASLGPEVRQGRLLFWTTHSIDSQLLNRTGLSGSFPNPHGGDLLAITLANAANNKLDAYQQETTSDTVTYNPLTGHVTARVTVAIRNTIPMSVKSPYVVGSYAGSGLPLGTDAFWLSLYTPLRIVSANRSGAPFQLTSPIGEDGVQVSSGYLDIPRQSESTITFALEGYIRPGSAYSLTTRLQPLATRQVMTASASASTGWPLSAGESSRWTADDSQIQRHIWEFSAP